MFALCFEPNVPNSAIRSLKALGMTVNGKLAGQEEERITVMFRIWKVGKKWPSRVPTSNRENKYNQCIRTIIRTLMSVCFIYGIKFLLLVVYMAAF